MRPFSAPSIRRACEKLNTTCPDCRRYATDEFVPETPLTDNEVTTTVARHYCLLVKHTLTRCTVRMKYSGTLTKLFAPITWTKRFFVVLLSSNPLLTLLGIAFSSLGVAFSETVVINVGILFLTIVFIFTAWSSRPPKRLSVGRLADQGDSISLQDLERLDTPVTKLGLLGDTQSGKTTFRQLALQVPPRAQRTIRIDVAITPLRTAPPTFAALIDGDGTLFDHQLQICDYADFILLFVDHNVGDRNRAMSQTRLRQHDTFLKQVQYRLGNRRPRRLHFVLNKRDLWEGTKNEDELIKWFYGHVEAWTHARTAQEVSYSLHSNRSSEDINHVLTEIQG